MSFPKDYLRNFFRSFLRPKTSVQEGKFGRRGSRTKSSQPTASSFTLESLEPRVLLSAGLTAGYAFNETSGTTAADTSGNAIVGTLTNGPTWAVGKYDNAVNLDGLNDYVNLGTPAALQVTGSLTLSAWVNASTFPVDDAAVVSKRASGELGFQLDVTKDTGPRTIGFKLTNSSGGQMFRYGATTLQPNTWYHIAGVYDAATQSLHVYLNGQLDDGVLQGTVTTSQQNSSTTNVTIGRRAGTTGFEFAGRIDDVRIYDRALTATEILDDTLSPLGTPVPDTIAPTVLSLNRATTSPTNAATVQWTVTFSEAVTGVDLTDFALAATGVTGAALSNVTGSGTTYTVTASTGTGSGTLGLNLVDNDSIVDGSANPLGGTGTGNGNVTGQVYTIDKAAPTGTIGINDGAAATNSRNVTLTLSATDVLSNVAQMRFSNTGTSFSAAETFAPTKAWTLSTGAGTKTVYVQYMDGVGNWSTIAITDTIVLDTTAPTISSRTATNITNSSATITWTTSEPATSQVDYGLTTSYGSITTLDPTLVLSHSVILSGLASDTTYNYRVRSRDAAGNERVTANGTFKTAVGADTVAPTVLSLDRATTSPTNAATVQWTVTFSEPVTGVDLADFALAATGVTGAALSSVTGSGTTYSVTASTGAGNGTLGLNLVDNDSIVDGSANPLGGTGTGNGNVTGQVYTIDKAAPTVTINQATGQTDPAGASPINFTVVFSKAVTGFTTGDVTLSGTAGATTATVTGSGTTYNVAVSGMTTSGTVIATVAAGVASDAAGNLNQAATSTDNTVSFASTQTAGLVAGWSFDETSGTSALDSSGNGNTATLVNGVARTTGKYDGGLTFDGGNDYLTVPNSASLNVSGTGLTVSLWINPQAAGNDSVVLGKFWNATMTSPYYQYGLELAGGTVPVFYVGTTGGVLAASMGSGLALNQWSYLAVTFNGTQAQFSVNGTVVTTVSLPASITARANPLQLGADNTPAQYFRGALDDVRIYGRALTAAEIQTDMLTALGGTGSTDPNPPVVQVTQPTQGSLLNGIVVVSADATDDVAVAGVQFFIDGVATGAFDATLPYALSWDTRTVGNGAHTLTARAYDTGSNSTLSAPVTVNVSNSNNFRNEILATGFDLPAVLKFLPDGRALVAEVAGVIKVVPPPYTTPDPTPFLDLNLNIPGYAGIQQGIQGVALDPNFVTNHYYYVFYTNDSPNKDRLSRFTANSALDGTIPGSEVVLYEDPQVADTEHHGGAINFGNDGKIYFTTGDHFQGAPAQDLTSPRGKVLRINPDGTVPTDNPFYDGNGPNYDAIWAYGLRNPFRASYDAPTGRLFIGDVGGNDWSTAKEEVNLGVRGANYGWPNVEGTSTNPNYTNPIYSYAHNGRDAAVVSGFVYRGNQFPSSYQGNYFFADYTQNWIKRLTFDANGSVTGVFNFEPADGTVDGPYGDIVDLTEGPDGALYYLDLGYSDVGGTFGVSKLRRIQYIQGNLPPVVQASATPTEGANPLTVTFSSLGSSDPEGQLLTYQWTFGDGQTSTLANPQHTYATPGLYQARLTVSDGVNSTISPPIQINVGDKPVITNFTTTPANNGLFRAGDVISFSATASDSEDGVLQDNAFTWMIDFLHGGHVHPGALLTGVTSGTFTVPTSGHDFSGDTRYRITLTVTDSTGLQTTRTSIVYPDKVNLTFDTAPGGLTIYLDGIAHTAPFVYDTLISFNHTIEARNQTVGTSSYTFASWSDGGTQQHTITVPTSPQNYTANYTLVTNPLPSGLVAGWNFNETSGTSAQDSSGNGNTATLVNGIARTTGNYGGGLTFDGVNDYITVPNSSSLNIAGSGLTLSMWINPQASGSDSVVLGKFWNATMTSPYYQYGLELTGGTIPNFFIGTSGGPLSASMSSALALNQWSYLAVVFNGSQVRYYVNGVLVTTAPLTATITGGNNGFQIGADNNIQQFFKGSLDEMRIYNRALTAQEVLTDMNSAG